MSARDALLGGAIPSESSPYHLEAAGIEPSSSARTRRIGRLALQGGLIPPDRAHSGRFQMSGEPKLVHAAPLYYAGEYLPRNPLRTRVQSQPSSRNENGPEPLGAILISGGGG